MFSQFEEDMEYEFNARFDYISEAYAATVLDGWSEGYCDYCDDCDENGDEPLDFGEWKRREMDRTAATRACPVGYGDDEIPF
jgi:hypothetical protein